MDLLGKGCEQVAVIRFFIKKREKPDVITMNDIRQNAGNIRIGLFFYASFF